MKIREAAELLKNVPESKRNDFCVIDGQVRLMEALKLARRTRAEEDEAPDYVIRSYDGLVSWINHRNLSDDR